MRAHSVEWRLGWSLWIAAGAALLLFYRWLAIRSVRRGLALAALALATVGFVADLFGESALILLVPDVDYSFAQSAFYLSGGVGNGLYSVAGALLTVAVPLRGRLATIAWLIWACGAIVAIAAFASPIHIAPTAAAWAGVAALASAALFALLVPWCVLVGRALR